MDIFILKTNYPFNSNQNNSSHKARERSLKNLNLNYKKTK